MSNRYDAYIQIGRALRTGNEKLASNIAKVIIKSDRVHHKKGVFFSENLSIPRNDKKILKVND